jgi:hypothetical protein
MVSWLRRWFQAASSLLRAAAHVFAHQIDEAPMNAAIGGEFRMKGGGKDMSLLDQDREAVALGEDFDAGAGLGDARGTDVDEL